MGGARHSPPSLLLAAAFAACLVTVALGLAVPQDAAGVHLLRHKRSSNSSSPPEPPKDSNGRPLPPPDGYAHGRGKRNANSAVVQHSLDSDTITAASEEYTSSAGVHLLRHKRSSNSSSPPEPPKDSNGRPLPPPDGYAHGRGKRNAYSAVVQHSLDSDTITAASEEYTSSGAAREKRSSGDELVSSADVVEVNAGRIRRSSNHSAPPRGPPPSRGRRGAGDQQSGAEAEHSVWLERSGTASRERRAANHSGPPRGPPPGSSRRQVHLQTEDEEVARSWRQRRDSTSDSSEGSNDDDDDDDDEEDSTSPGRGQPPRGRPPPGGAPHGMGPPPRGCGGRRPSSGSGTNDTSTETDTERLSRRRGRNRG